MNSGCSIRSVDDKVMAAKLHMSSTLEAVKALAAHHAGQASFNRGDIDNRGQNLASMVLERWRLFNSVQPASAAEQVAAIQTREAASALTDTGRPGDQTNESEPSAGQAAN